MVPERIVNASNGINDFESSSEKEFSKFDKENEKIYSAFYLKQRKHIML